MRNAHLTSSCTVQENATSRVVLGTGLAHLTSSCSLACIEIYYQIECDKN
ncbi:hypothetical protein AVDCRST_MAG84-3244 [uncultured Microcoleus sp.]|uniref:Uncharacterized protein n=1 Tax=uncultured Microcoleus sp. TaxID=259945 RepID=A0A6J4MF80_9CYAN|nr:hypothetical protein AVDCRST_MAG84-3244 [uncultured Microcoleus sp.]